MSPIHTKPLAQYDPAPEGLHQAVAVDVVDLGDVDSGFGLKPMVEIYWELPEQINPKTGKPFIVRHRYNNSVHAKATLRKHLKNWRGRDFTAEELNGFDLESVLGANCQLQVVHNIAKDGRTFANVEGLVRLGQGQQPVAPSGTYVRKAQRQNNGGLNEPEPDPNEYVPF